MRGVSCCGPRHVDAAKKGVLPVRLAAAHFLCPFLVDGRVFNKGFGSGCCDVGPIGVLAPMVRARGAECVCLWYFCIFVRYEAWNDRFRVRFWCWIFALDQREQEERFAARAATTGVVAATVFVR